MTTRDPDPRTSREDLLDSILHRSATNQEFRSGLLEDPRTTILTAFGVEVPVGYRLRFIEKGPELDSLVVLPDFRQQEGELSDEDLESVNGGTGLAEWKISPW